MVQVDLNAVVEKLKLQLADAMVQNAMLQAGVEQLEFEVNEQEAVIDELTVRVKTYCPPEV